MYLEANEMKRSDLLKCRLIGMKFHHYSNEIAIYTDNQNIYINKKNSEIQKISLVGKWIHHLSLFRLAARFFRSDQYNIIPTDEMRSLYVIRDGKVYRIRLGIPVNIKCIGKLPFRGIMHNAHCVLPCGKIIFGFYGNMSKNKRLLIYIIDPVHETLEEKEILTGLKAKHIHAVRWDTFTNSIWLCTGDDDGECHIIVLNEQLKILKVIGDGTQKFRTCDFIFFNDHVIWCMDSPLKQSYVIKYDRSEGYASTLSKIDGPGWFVVKVGLYYFLSIVHEPGISVKTNGPQILMSMHGDKWELYKQYVKDRWPSIFKFGVSEIGSSDGVHLYINHQASKGLDGVSEVFDLQIN